MNLINLFKYINLPFTDLLKTANSIQFYEIITTLTRIGSDLFYHEAVITISSIANHLIRSSIYDFITFII